MNCKDCDFWKKDNVYPPDVFEKVKVGKCACEKIAINPNYYTEYEGVAASNMAISTYSFLTAEEFGCIHFKQKKHETITTNSNR